MKKIIAIMAVMTVTLSMAGCGNKDENLSKADKSTSLVSSENEVQTVDESESASEKINKNESARPESEMVLPKGEFNFDKATDNFYLYGEKVEFPFSVDTLSDTFVWDKYFIQNEDDNVYNSLFYKEIGSSDDEKIAQVTFNDVLNKDYDGKYYKVSMQDFDTSKACANIWLYEADYNLYGIKPKMTFDEVKKLWGTPSEENENALYYKTDDNKEIILCSYSENNDEVIEKIGIFFEEDK